MAKRTTPARTRTNAAPHAHEKGRCLDILRQLSAFIDDELTTDICAEIRQHLGACPNCEDFVASLRQTVALCRHQPAPSLSPEDRARMRARILNTVAGQ